MRKLVIWGGLAALLAGLGMAAAGAASKGEAKGTSGGWSWVPSWLKWGKKADQEKPDKAARPVPASRPAPLVDERSAVISREQAAWQRRMAVCLELRQIAQDTNDNYLLSQVEQLEERAWATYARRISNVPLGGSSYDLDEQLLDKHLTAPATAGRPLTSPSAANDKGRSNSAAVRGR
jgi:hypothetical protein